MEGLTAHTHSGDAIPGKSRRVMAKTRLQEKKKVKIRHSRALAVSLG